MIEDTLPPFTLFSFFFPSPSIDRGGKHEGRKDEEQKEVEGGDGNEPGEEDRIGFAPRKRNLPSVFHGQRGRFEGRVKIQGCCYVALDSWFLNVSWCCHLSIIIVNDVFKGLYLSFNNFFFFHFWNIIFLYMWEKFLMKKFWSKKIISILILSKRISLFYILYSILSARLAHFSLSQKRAFKPKNIGLNNYIYTT